VAWLFASRNPRMQMHTRVMNATLKQNNSSDHYSFLYGPVWILQCAVAVLVLYNRTIAMIQRNTHQPLFLSTGVKQLESIMPGLVAD